MGGNIALWFAKNHPDRVLGLCVIAPAVSARLIPIGFRRWAWMSKPVSLALNRRWMRWAHDLTVSKPELVDQERIEETFRTYGRQSDAVRAFMLATEAIRDARLNQSLVELQTPTLILWGSRDKLVNRRIIDDLETALVKAESQVHLGGGHHLQEDEPEWVAEKLVAFFLNSHD